jgi:hypothetical protein
MLWDPAAHEPPLQEPWNGDRLEGLEPDEPGAGLHGIGRYTLWTGDLGTALYLADCVDGAGRLPLP